MSLDIITKTKLTIKPISISYNKLSSNEIDSIVFIERQNSENPWSKTQLLESIQNPTNLCYSFSIDSHVLGFLIAMPAVDTADILNISINADYQRKGYGKGLLNLLIEDLKNREIRQIILEVRESNQIAISFNLKQGFEKISVRKNYYMNGSKHTHPKEDGIMMSLKF